MSISPWPGMSGGWVVECSRIRDVGETWGWWGRFSDEVNRRRRARDLRVFFLV